jgi:uncharacterized membrane protein YbaN (DUF454 family)
VLAVLVGILGLIVPIEAMSVCLVFVAALFSRRSQTLLLKPPEAEVH